MKTYKFILCLVIFVILNVEESHGHMRWSYPAARSANFGIKGPYPCGSDAFWGSGQPNTNLAPGNITLQWLESVNHAGAPFRIALSYGDDTHYNTWILLDHLPHNDQQGNVPYKSYSYSLVIPDINCSRCSLQILDMMTDKIPSGSCCTYPGGSDECFSVYHSCANIIITGANPPSQFSHSNAGPTGPYTQESGTWTYNGSTWWLTKYTPYNPNLCITSTTGSGSTNSSSVMIKKDAKGLILPFVVLGLGGIIVLVLGFFVYRFYHSKYKIVDDSELKLEEMEEI